MSVLNANATIMLLPPNLVVNEDSKSLNDKLTGNAAGFYNEILRYSRINATIIGAETIGGCQYSDLEGSECTGIVGLLQSGAADISLMPVVMDFDPRIGAPFEVAFPVFEQEHVFLSSPISNVTAVELHILSTILRFDKVLLCCYFVFYAFLIGLISWSRRSGKFRSRIKWPDTLFLMVWGSTTKTFRLWPRRLALLFATLITFLYIQLYMCSTQSSLVLVQPEKYIETVAEVATSDKKIIVLNGLTIDQVLQTSSNPIFAILNIRSERITASEGTVFAAAADQMADGQTVLLLGSIALAYIVESFYCINTDCSPKHIFRYSKPFGRTFPSVAFSKTAEASLKFRYRQINSRMCQSGIYEWEHTDFTSKFAVLVSVFEGRFRQCMARMNSRESKDSNEVSPVTLRSVRLILWFPAAGAVTGSLALGLELLVKGFKKRKRRKKKTQVS